MKVIIIIPTLNEEKSLNILIKKLRFLIKKKKTILFVDDNSTDKTRSKIIEFEKKYKNIKHIFRDRNHGLGASIKDGYKYAIKYKFDICITMDADGTHNPKNIPKMINLVQAKRYDIVSTNRFLIKKSLKKWPFLRLLLTKTRYYLVNFFLNTKNDTSGNFRCFNLNTIKKKHLFLSKNDSYFFLIESFFYLENLKYNIVEIPIVLGSRVFGYSKMRLGHVFQSFMNLLKLYFSTIFLKKANA